MWSIWLISCEEFPFRGSMLPKTLMGCEIENIWGYADWHLRDCDDYAYGMPVYMPPGRVDVT